MPASCPACIASPTCGCSSGSPSPWPAGSASAQSPSWRYLWAADTSAAAGGWTVPITDPLTLQPPELTLVTTRAGSRRSGRSACPPPRGPPAGRWSPRGWQRPVWLSCFYLHCQVRPSWLPALPWGGRDWEGPVAREEQHEPSTSAPCATGTSWDPPPPRRHGNLPPPYSHAAAEARFPGPAWGQRRVPDWKPVALSGLCPAGVGVSRLSKQMTPKCSPWD